MKTYISSIHLYEESNTLAESLDPQFRKATANMLAAYEVCKKSYDTLSGDEKNSLSFVVATHFGEATSSLEFLSTLKETDLAKPILFQNSLHNSTTGFVSIQLGITGPALTISADELTDEAVSNTVKGLLNLTDHVLVCYVDIIPDFLKKHYAATFPKLKSNLGFAKSFIISKKQLNNAIPIQLDEFRVNNVYI